MHLFTSTRQVFGALVIAAGLALAPTANAVTFSDVYVFGDSLSDSGNIFATTTFPVAPYSPGRITGNFTDGTPGAVWIEYVAAYFGASATNTLNGGTNYAWAGARTGPVNAGFPPSLLDQVGFYLADSGGVADANALYTVFGGGNDVRDGLTANSVSNIESMILSLAAAGAQNFLVPNLPDIGLTPESLGDGAPGGPGALISQLSNDFNADLAAMLDNLEANMEINIVRFDLFSLFTQVLADPGAFDMANVTDVCWDGDFFGNGNLCADPDSYLFFDGIHPTAQGHLLVGEYAIDAIEAAFIPVPAALPLLLGALGALGLVRRRA